MGAIGRRLNAGRSKAIGRGARPNRGSFVVVFQKNDLLIIRFYATVVSSKENCLWKLRARRHRFTDEIPEEAPDKGHL
jgi:hypothetical protein